MGTETAFAAAERDGETEGEDSGIFVREEGGDLSGRGGGEFFVGGCGKDQTDFKSWQACGEEGGEIGDGGCRGKGQGEGGGKVEAREGGEEDVDCCGSHLGSSY